MAPQGSGARGPGARPGQFFHDDDEDEDSSCEVTQIEVGQESPLHDAEADAAGGLARDGAEADGEAEAEKAEEEAPPDAGYPEVDVHGIPMMLSATAMPTEAQLDEQAMEILSSQEIDEGLDGDLYGQDPAPPTKVEWRAEATEALERAKAKKAAKPGTGSSTAVLATPPQKRQRTEGSTLADFSNAINVPTEDEDAGDAARSHDHDDGCSDKIPKHDILTIADNPVPHAKYGVIYMNKGKASTYIYYKDSDNKKRQLVEVKATKTDKHLQAAGRPRDGDGPGPRTLGPGPKPRASAPGLGPGPWAAVPERGP